MGGFCPLGLGKASAAAMGQWKPVPGIALVQVCIDLCRWFRPRKGVWELHVPALPTPPRPAPAPSSLLLAPASHNLLFLFLTTMYTQNSAVLKSQAIV